MNARRRGSPQRSSGAPLLALLAFGLVAPDSARAETCVFASSTPLVIGESTVTSTIPVSGVGGPLTDVEIALVDLAETQIGVEELDLLLVSPAGVEVILMSFACIETKGPLDLTFSRAAATVIPSADFDTGSYCVSKAYRPGDYSALVGGYLLASNPPAPAPPYPGDLDDLLAGDPNGGWKLYAAAFSDLDEASLAGWSLRFSAASCGAPTAALFVDDFETGDACAWSTREGTPDC